MKRLMVQTKWFGGLFAKTATIIFLAVLLTTVAFHAAFAATAPSLGTAQSFAVVAETVTNTGETVINGHLGVSPGAIAPSGFPPGIVNGVQQIGNGVSLQAKSDARAAYNNLASQACTTTYIVPTDLGGLTLVPGVYCFASSAGLTGPVPLTLAGGAGDVWVFKTVSTLITGPGSSVVMSGGGQECNVFWQIGSAATLDTTTQFIGNILAHDDISLNNGANVSGRLMAGMQASGAGAVTLINNNVSPSACAVSVPPTLVKDFEPATINAGGNSTLTITLSNSNSTPVTGASLTDTLPTGETFFSPATSDCAGVLLTSGDTVTLTGGSIPANSFCTVTAVVTSSVVGPHINTAALTTDQGSASASATLTVVTPGSTTPTLSKTFSTAIIDAGQNSTLTITLGNTNSAVASFATFTDTLPIGVTFVGAASNNGCGGTIANDANTVTLTLGSIPANGTCTVTATVTSSVSGLHLNTTGALVTDQGTAPPASDTLIVNPITPISILKSFAPDTIDAGGVTLLTITVNNPNTSIAIPVGFVDFLPPSPGQMLVATGPAPLINTCGGTLTAASGSASIIYEGGLLPSSSSCAVTVYVTAPVSGDYTNTLGTAVANLTVTAPANITPTLVKSFSPSTINAGGFSTVTIILTNPGDTAATIISFIDTLPSGLVVAGSGPNASTTSGTLTAITGQSTVTLTGGSIPANGFVIIKFDVYAPVAGTYVNTLAIGTLQTSNGNNTASTAATLIVNPRPPGSPTLKKSFSPITIKAGGVSTLTIVLTNPNSTAATLMAPLTDYFPSGLVVAGTGSNASTTCGGTLTAITGQSKIVLTGGSIPANGSCRVKVDVTAKCGGSYLNKLPDGALQTNKGSNATSATATLKVLFAPKLSKSFSPSTIYLGKVSTLSITLYNSNSTVAKLTAPLTDYFPSGLVVASTPNARTTCGGTLSANTGSSKLIQTGGAIPANGSCMIKVNVTSKSRGSYRNTLPVGVLQTDKGNNVTAAAATLTVR